MKKWLCLFFICLLLVGCQKAQTEKLEIQGIQTIPYEELTEKLDENVTFLLYIGRPDCGDCQEFYPILEEYINAHEGTGIYYLNIKQYRDQAREEDATQEEKDFYENLYQRLDFDWTPTIQIFTNGQIVKSYQYLDEDYFEIQDRQEQLKKKQMFLDEFEVFMNDYFEEESV